jgi:hypothetical protein
MATDVQIFLAGLGVFSVTGHGASTDSAFGAHRGLGLADNAALYGGLHALDGLLVLGIAGFLYASARRRRA